MLLLIYLSVFLGFQYSAILSYYIAFMGHNFNVKHFIPFWGFYLFFKTLEESKLPKIYLHAWTGQLIVDDGNKRYYQKLDGKFVRPCEHFEFQRLIKLDTLFEIKLLNNDLKYALKKDEQVPIWTLLASTKVQIDESNYQQSLSANGGAYSFTTTRHFLFSIQNERFHFGYIDENTSSANFPMDWNGHFNNSLTSIRFTNGPADLQPTINAQFYDNKNIEFDCVENFLTECNLEDIITEKLSYLSPLRDTVGNSYVEDAFNEEEKNKIRETLQQYSWNENKNYKKRR